MEKNICPNYGTCRLVNAPEFPLDETAKAQYLANWCTRDEAGWSQCKRYITRDEMGFCPDFVMPDSDLTRDEIMDKFDEEEI